MISVLGLKGNGRKGGMMQRVAIVWIAGLLLSVSACTGPEQYSRKEKETRTYDSAYDLVYEAVKEVLAKRGYDIAKADPELGLVETEWLAGKSLRTKARVEVKPTGRHMTEVSAAIRVEEAKGSHWAPKEVKVSLYQDLFDDIDLQVYREHFRKIERRSKEGK